jgi:uncharacterized protein (DUF736 family)
MENKKKDIGGIWIKSGQYGDYLSIQVEINGVKHNFSAFPNKYKELGDKKPDYRIPEPKAKDDGQSSYQSKIALVKEYQAKKPATQKPLADNESEDVPF